MHEDTLEGARTGNLDRIATALAGISEPTDREALAALVERLAALPPSQRAQVLKRLEKAP